ncbi:hypothetical protein KA531_02280 [Candidatus Saccharibacteria bacterium]|nr:hypothetical protein [Candidatus Saccharibacteria bacterium]
MSNQTTPMEPIPPEYSPSETISPEEIAKKVLPTEILYRLLQNTIDNPEYQEFTSSQNPDKSPKTSTEPKADHDHGKDPILNIAQLIEQEKNLLLDPNTGEPDSEIILAIFDRFNQLINAIGLDYLTMRIQSELNEVVRDQTISRVKRFFKVIQLKRKLSKAQKQPTILYKWDGESFWQTNFVKALANERKTKPDTPLVDLLANQVYETIIHHQYPIFSYLCQKKPSN